MIEKETGEFIAVTQDGTELKGCYSRSGCVVECTISGYAGDINDITGLPFSKAVNVLVDNKR